MNHIDEHRLELYVLDPVALGNAAADVEEHLAVCVGCSLIVEQIRSFYDEADKALDQTELPTPASNKSLALRKDDSVDVYEPIDRLSVRRMEPTRGIILNFTRRHPVASGTGAFAVLAASLAVVFLFTRGPSDKNPAFVHLNPAQEMLEAYNAEHERLWAIPARDVEGTINLEGTHGVAYVHVMDLDGDGKRDVISIMKLSEDARDATPRLRVFNDAGTERFAKKVGAAVTFDGTEYNESYTPNAVAVSDPGINGRRELFVLGTNLHSPSVIARVSSSGDILGEYWHFGSFYGLAKLIANGKESIVAWGTNDVPDVNGHSDSSFAVILLLDPTRIVGTSESSCTRGFGFPASEAELRYIRLPRSDIEETLSLPAATNSMSIERDSVLTFSTNFDAGARGMLTIFWSFTKDLRPLEVRFNDITEEAHRKMVTDGVLKSPWVQSDFENLKARIQFLR